jgi:hypothetical protein
MGNGGTQDHWVNFTAPCGCSGQQFLPGGATSDYAANLGDLSPGATGADTDFYWGGKGTGVIITVRPRCDNESPVDWVDRISMAQVTDGTSHTVLVGELHVPLHKLNVAPEHAAAYNGTHFASYARVGGPGAPLAPNASYVDPNLFSFGSWHPGVCQFARTDASVRAMNVETSTTLPGHLCHRQDGWPQGE